MYSEASLTPDKNISKLDSAIPVGAFFSLPTEDIQRGILSSIHKFSESVVTKLITACQHLRDNALTVKRR